MDCVPHIATGLDDQAVEQVVTALGRDGGTVVVGVLGRPGPARRAIDGQATVVPLDDPADRPVATVAVGLQRAPGRCVVVLREGDTGWDLAVAESAPATPAPYVAPASALSRLPQLDVHTGARFGIGAAAGFTSYVPEDDATGARGDRSFQPAGTPALGAALSWTMGQTSFVVGFESLPAFNFTFGGSGHVWSRPVALLALGLEYRLGPVGVGVAGGVGYAAATGGPYGRVRLVHGERWDHDLELRATWVVRESGLVALLYSPSLHRREGDR